MTSPCVLRRTWQGSHALLHLSCIVGAKPIGKGARNVACDGNMVIVLRLDGATNATADECKDILTRGPGGNRMRSVALKLALSAAFTVIASAVVLSATTKQAHAYYMP